MNNTRDKDIKNVGLKPNLLTTGFCCCMEEKLNSKINN